MSRWNCIYFWLMMHTKVSHSSITANTSHFLQPEGNKWSSIMTIHGSIRNSVSVLFTVSIKLLNLGSAVNQHIVTLLLLPCVWKMCRSDQSPITETWWWAVNIQMMHFADAPTGYRIISIIDIQSSNFFFLSQPMCRFSPEACIISVC